MVVDGCLRQDLLQGRIYRSLHPTTRSQNQTQGGWVRATNIISPGVIKHFTCIYLFCLELLERAFHDCFRIVAVCLILIAQIGASLSGQIIQHFVMMVSGTNQSYDNFRKQKVFDFEECHNYTSNFSLKSYLAVFIDHSDSLEKDH